MRTYFITGLPRSRTAWIANFMTSANSFCFHEALMFCGQDINKMPGLFESIYKDNVGNCCSSIPLFMDEIESFFPASRYVLIKHDMDRVAKELQQIFNVETREGVIFLAKKLDEFEARFKPLVINFEDLNSAKSCRAMWEHCIEGAPFNELRYQMLNDFDIQLTQTGLDKRRKLLCR